MTSVTDVITVTVTVITVIFGISKDIILDVSHFSYLNILYLGMKNTKRPGESKSYHCIFINTIE